MVVAAVANVYVPALQWMQIALPFVILYLPASHAEHVPPSAPVYPANKDCIRESKKITCDNMRVIKDDGKNSINGSIRELKPELQLQFLTSVLFFRE